MKISPLMLIAVAGIFYLATRKPDKPTRDPVPQVPGPIDLNPLDPADEQSIVRLGAIARRQVIIPHHFYV